MIPKMSVNKPMVTTMASPFGGKKGRSPGLRPTSKSQSGSKPSATMKRPLHAFFTPDSTEHQSNPDEFDSNVRSVTVPVEDFTSPDN